MKNEEWWIWNDNYTSKRRVKYILHSKNKGTTLPAEGGWCLCFPLTPRRIYFPWCSLETVSCLRPFLRRAERTRRPFLVCIRRRKPCLLMRLRLWGWNVLFIVISVFVLVFLLLKFTLVLAWNKDSLASRIDKQSAQKCILSSFHKLENPQNGVQN